MSNNKLNVQDENLVIVRSFNYEWRTPTEEEPRDFNIQALNNFKFYFGGSGNEGSKPKQDAYYLALYSSQPQSAITHIGIIESIDRSEMEYCITVKSLIKLKEPVQCTHPVISFEYWHLADLRLNASTMNILKCCLENISNK